MKPLIGAHISIAGGLPAGKAGIENTPIRAKEEGCETFQCFTRSPQGGVKQELSEKQIGEFESNMKKSGIERFVIHAPYTINLASEIPRIRHSSISIIRDELERGTKLGADFVMFHPGSCRGQPRPSAIASVQKSLEQILDKYNGTTELLVEISAGAGEVLGSTFAENAEMISTVKSARGFGGICFDTCHAFASGYDFRTTEKANAMLEEFDRTIGLNLLKLSHVQDSKTDLGGKRDRHEHIGGGFIGDGLKALLDTKEFRHIDWILETESDGRNEDIKHLKYIRDSHK